MNIYTVIIVILPSIGLLIGVGWGVAIMGNKLKNYRMQVYKAYIDLIACNFDEGTMKISKLFTDREIIDALVQAPRCPKEQDNG